MTSTEIPLASAKPRPWPARSHTIVVIMETVITAGTKNAGYPVCCLGNGSFGGSSIAYHLYDLGEGGIFSTRVAWQRKKPDWLEVAADTRSPCDLSTGMLSPVRQIRLLRCFLLIQYHLRVYFLPGRTTKISPDLYLVDGDSVSAPFFISVAVLVASFIRPFRASVVRPLERAPASCLR